MAKTQGLGRGLDSLIPITLDVNEVASPGETIKQMSVDKLVANPDQPRKSFDDVALQELADSIKQHGVIQPIVATPHTTNGVYRIVAGERRYRASLKAGLKKLPVIIRNHKELEELEIALVENVQRVDLSPLEQAVSIVRLHDQFSMSYKDIAKKLGKAETTISNMIRLLQLPKEAVEAMQKNLISEGHARAILALKTDTEEQKKLLNTIVTQGISVRSAEEYVKDHKQQQKTNKSDTSISPSAQKLLDTLPQKVAKRTQVKQLPKGKGRVVLSYADETQLQEILRLIRGL